MIRGSGPVFSAGYDIGGFDEGRFEEAAERLVAHPFQAALEALDAYPYPVIGQLNGHAIGGGLELALACDFRIAASGIKVGMPPAKLGLIYSHTGLRRFIDVCGVANTAELFYVGRNVDVARAERMGLVNEIVDPAELDERVLDLADGGRRQRAPVAGGQQARDPHAARPPAARGRRARADRAARVVLPLGGLPRGRARLRGEAQAALAGAVGRSERSLSDSGAYRPRSVPPLISQEEALRLGQITDHAEIEALIERAWKARVERFDDSTDMCSLVNAKSGGCAEDCGFCAQSRFAEADTPMHAMMTPEQILEHARAAEAAGAHRFCMVTQGQGLSKRDFDNVVEGAKLVAEHTNLKRCASIGHMSVERARQLKDAGIQRVHHNVETAESFYPEVSTTVRYEGRLRTISAVEEAGLETCVGGILNLGETPEQRVEMAFQLARIDPTSVPINMLIPKSGTKFGDREQMDPWEAVKWIAIFRLILPAALLRLCGGRIENLGELHKLAVKAGINGVMMGNFLTTLGSEPEDDRAMFEELGLNVARQADNGSNPRPDNRSGWLDGEAPRTPVDELIDSQDEANFWDPSTQLRHRRKTSVPPRPDGAPNAFPEVVQVDAESRAIQGRRVEGLVGQAETRGRRRAKARASEAASDE